MARKLVSLTIEAEDIGGTYEIKYLLGEREVFSYYPGTAYEETAFEAGEELLGDALRHALSALADNG